MVEHRDGQCCYYLRLVSWFVNSLAHSLAGAVEQVYIQATGQPGLCRVQAGLLPTMYIRSKSTFKSTAFLKKIECHCLQCVCTGCTLPNKFL